MQEPLRLTRDLVDRLPDKVEAMGPVRWVPPSEDYHAATAARIAAEAREHGALWVFAFGSLIWNPRFPEVERRPAIAHGWRRSFCLGPITRMRGNPDAPGLMLSLDRGGACRGVAIRMDPADHRGSLEALLRTEPPSPPRWIRLRTPRGPLRAIAFTCDRSHWTYVTGLTEEEIADRLARAVGHVGSMPDYLLNTVAHLEDAGIRDGMLWRMQALVAERLERLPPRPG